METIPAPGIGVRRIQPDDARMLREFFVALGEETQYLLFGPGECVVEEGDLRRHIEQLSSTGHGLEFIATGDDIILGHITLRQGSRPRNRHCGNLGLIVSREHWGLGIGTALMHTLLDAVRNTGEIRKVNLAVHIENIRAIRLYERFGFIREGLRTRDCRVNGIFHDCLLMGLHLDPESV